MPGNRVEWSIDIDSDSADSPQDAALQAFAHMQRPGTSANFFHVYEVDGSGEAIPIDLQEIEEAYTEAEIAEAAATHYAKINS